MLQEGKERREGVLVARKRELSSTVYDANAHRAALGVVGQCEEDVLLPAVADEEASKRRLPQHAVGVLYTERAPVETTAFEFRCCGRDDIAVFLAGEGGEVGPLWQLCQGWSGFESREWPSLESAVTVGAVGIVVVGWGRTMCLDFCVTFHRAVGYHPTGESGLRPSPISDRHHNDILRGDKVDVINLSSLELPLGHESAIHSELNSSRPAWDHLRQTASVVLASEKAATRDITEAVCARSHTCSPNTRGIIKGKNDLVLSGMQWRKFCSLKFKKGGGASGLQKMRSKTKNFI